MGFIGPILFSITAFLGAVPLSTKFPVHQNEPPKVTIIAPDADSYIQTGKQVLYDIEVVDTEDGDSRYGEINPAEVYLEVHFFPNGSADTINLSKIANPNGLSLIKVKGCFTCHNSKTALVGPSFSDIAERYDDLNLQDLANSILAGTTENWGNFVMPAQVDVNEAEARNMAQWILSKGNNDNLTVYAGIQGSFSTKEDRGDYLLVASYLDHGIEQDPGSRFIGLGQMVIKAR